MAAYLLRIAAVNFERMAGDVQDLSTLRGGSRAMLHAPQRAFDHLRATFGARRVSDIYVGASEGLARLAEDVDPAAAEREARAFLARGVGTDTRAPRLDDLATAVFRHLTFVVDAVPEGEDYAVGERRALAANRLRQLRQPSVDLPLPTLIKGTPTRWICAIDGTRPAVTEARTGEGPQRVSASVARRRFYGRRLRQRFYTDELSSSSERAVLSTLPPFADRFADIVEPKPGNVHESVETKVAVLYMDGNGFTDARTQTVRSADDAAAFSRHVKARRRALLAAMLAALGDALRERFPDGRKTTPFETLLWGADELRVIFPAWALRPVMRAVEAQIIDPAWTFRDKPLTHAAGLVLCAHTTPIAAVAELAEELAAGAKARGKDRSRLQYMVLESHEPPAEGVGARRQALFGTDDHAAFTFTLDGSFSTLLEWIEELQGADGLATSQLYDLVRRAVAARRRHGPHRFDPDDVKALIDRAEDACPPGLGSPFAGNLLPAPPKLEPVALFHLVELWRYANPFAGRVLP